MRNNKGVTLMSLIVTVVTMVILLSVVGYFSIDTVKNSHIANEKKEMADVVEYTSVRKAKLLIDEFDVNKVYGDSIITTEAIYLLGSGIPESGINKIIEVNSAAALDDNYKYVYVTAEKLNSESLSSENVIVKDAKNNYIINFFTGTVIALYDLGERVEISGTVKGLSEIMNEVNGL